MEQYERYFPHNTGPTDCHYITDGYHYYDVNMSCIIEDGLAISVDDNYVILSTYINRRVTYGDLVDYFGQPTKVSGYGFNFLHVCWKGRGDSYSFKTQGLSSLFTVMTYVSLWNAYCY